MTRWAILLGATLAAMVVGCDAATGTPATPTSPSTGSASASVAVVPSPSPEPSAAPPTAALAVEGGDPVDGQLGSYTWRDSGSDSPWLPGTPITVGLGEPLAVAFPGSPAIGSWRVQARPAAATGPVVGVAEGDGEIAFTAPDVGTWSMAIIVTFGGGPDAATYYWEVRVR